MKIREVTENQEFMARNGQLSAMGSTRPTPADQRRKRAKQTVEKLVTNFKPAK